MKGCQHST
ncbi:hypothetical protein AZE42_14163 [Rhizopogon vesiculosus]|uniref:Uncharacterized protein n=1 Tax=Rhizopogon vesiculosus TaxID=180088 RepID=A0A1J8QTK4_9AGAM|nr:hypothetical protein AZE42_14163 [Rhizopogon vesiculosus]